MMGIPGSTEGKVWGKTKCIIENPFCEVHLVNAYSGGVCSEHCHRAKTNLFLIISGQLLIRVWKDNLVDEIILESGEYTSVPPNTYHQFEAITDCTFIEVYFPEGITKDIVRRTTGFLK
jgi:quercetin dioxygenase-like cupin family protein